MYCPNCGKENEDSSRFCGNCSFKFPAEKAVGTATSVTKKPRKWYPVPVVVLLLIFGATAALCLFNIPYVSGYFREMNLPLPEWASFCKDLYPQKPEVKPTIPKDKDKTLELEAPKEENEEPVEESAQYYFFEVPEQDIHIFIEPNGSITIEYYFLFQNGVGAHFLDYIDINIPGNSVYSQGDIIATIDSQRITDIQDSPYVESGVALGLGANAISAEQSGIVYVRAENIKGQFYFTSLDENEDYTSIRFQPHYFASDYVSGFSDMTVTFHFSEGVTNQESQWVSPKNWPGYEAPNSSYDENNRVIYQWSFAQASASKKYEFGVAFPARYIPLETIITD